MSEEANGDAQSEELEQVSATATAQQAPLGSTTVSYTHLRAHET